MECLLPETLDISTVLDSASRYKEWLAEDNQLHIDASQVSRVDAAGLQALASLFLSAKKHQIEIQLIQPTQILVDAIGILSLDDQIGWNSELGEEKHDENSSCG